MRRLLVFALVAGLMVGELAAEANAVTPEIFTPDRAAVELMRLLEAERTFAGVSSLQVDPFLAWVARDGPVPCPDGGPVAEGRAKDMAVSGVLSHSLRLCPTADIGSALTAWGYRPWFGEIIAMNGGYDSTPFPYTVGCQIGDPYQEHCAGPATSAPMTVAIAATQFMSSAGHRAVALEPAYDRFACGAWQAPNGDDYYSCLYASGPGAATVPTPDPSTQPAPSTSPNPSPSIGPMPPRPRPTIQTSRPWRRYGRERLGSIVRSVVGVRAVVLTVDGRVRLQADCRGKGVCSPAISLRLRHGVHRVLWTATDRVGRSRTVHVTVRVP